MIEEKVKEIKRTLRVAKDGRVMKFVHEVYLRQDIGCGWGTCELCSQETSHFDFRESQFLFIPDYASLTTYYDALMNSNLRNFLVTQTIAERMRKESRHLFKRFKSSVELEKWRNIYVYPNEFSQRTAIPNSSHFSASDLDELHIFKTAEYFQEHFMGQVKVIIISENVNLMKKAKHLKNLECLKIREFVQKFSDNALQIMDFLGCDLTANVERILCHSSLRFDHAEYLGEKELLERTMSGHAFRGKIRFGRFNINEASITSSVLNREILIRGTENINRAIHGDIVVVELLDQSQWIGAERHLMQDDEVVEETEEQAPPQILSSEITVLKKVLAQGNKLPCARVIGIIKRDLRNFCGELASQTETFGLVSLTDSRYPEVLIEPQALEPLRGKKVMINVDGWPRQSRYPVGHLVKVLGDAEDVNVENEVILFEFNVDTRDFSQRVIDCLPKEGTAWTVSQEELEKRVDLREENVCSVDPPGCKDIDDALHAKMLPNGNIEVGVHIADVTHFVKPDTPIDQEAAERCTTVYLVNKRTDMLPKLLTESLCSLVSDVERLAFSVVWELDSQSLEILNTKFHKSVIKSKKAFTYEQAYQTIQDISDKSPLAQGLRLLLRISEHLKALRIAQGALQLASTQIKFSMTEEDANSPTDVSYYNLFPTNSMVEEFMLLANVAVGRKILQHFPSASVLRKHSSPKPERIKQLDKIMKLKGFALDYTTSGSLARSLDQIRRTGDPFFNKLVRIMTTRCMHEAVYFCSADFDTQEYRHYGLAADVYTHFTSPIRRYADVQVHRLLAASLGIESLSRVLSTKSKLVRACEQMNIKNRNARNASRASSEFFSYLFFKGKEFQEFAIVAGIQSNGFSLVVAKYGFEGFLEFGEEDLQRNLKLAEEDQERALTNFFYEGQMYTLFEWLKVAIKVTLVQYRKKIDLEIMQRVKKPPVIQLI